MDGNKDEALKCLIIGRRALEAGDLRRALKFATKARRLDPTLLVDDLLSAIEGQSSCAQSDAPADDSSTSSSRPPNGQSAQPSVRHRVSSGSNSSPPSVGYTEEQLTVVRQIKKKKDYYEILGLEKACTIDDVRKAYRKLSLKVHPDKNTAPGAEEAFKAVSKAFQCLSDEESRKRYDLVGSDEPVIERHTRRHASSHGFNGFSTGDVDAEEIFRNFFFSGMAPATTQFQGFQFGAGMGPRTGDHGSGGFNFRVLMQLLPVLLVLLLNFMPSSDPVYSLSRKHPYEYTVVTPKGINYYVRIPNYEEKYPPNTRERAEVETWVERDYMSIVSHNCHLEMQRFHWGYIRETPHCDLLRRFRSAA